MTENNNLTSDINLLKPLTTPRFTLGINAGALRRRTNERTFTITDTFGYLVARLNRKNRYGERYCDGKIVRKNYVYPIAGRIGVDKTVTTFLELTVFGSLGGEHGKGPPTLADKLTFTTAINLSVNPRIEFTPVTNSFQLANAAGSAGAVSTACHAGKRPWPSRVGRVGSSGCTRRINPSTPRTRTLVPGAIGPFIVRPRHIAPLTNTGPSGLSSPRVSPTRPTSPTWVEAIRSRDCTATVRPNPQYRTAARVVNPISHGDTSI